jgi:hypothetical protein
MIKTKKHHPPNKPKTYSRCLPNTAELLEIYKELLEMPNVHFCFVGKKTKKGASTSRTSIVCGVKTKIKRNDIEKKDLVPRHFVWLKHASHPRRILTDVVEMPLNFQFRQGPIIGPGDTVTAEDGSSATVGIAMRHPQFGEVVTTAGHLFSPNDLDQNVTVKSGDAVAAGKLIKRVRNNEVDYALIQMKGSCRILNLFRDRYAVGPTHFPNEEDLNRELRILSPGGGGSIGVTCRGIHGYFRLPGGPAMSNLIFTEDRTQRGDSGSCLIDESGAVWGLLVGGTCDSGISFSAFMPAYFPLIRERAYLI